jgi:hypothetical protein
MQRRGEERQAQRKEKRVNAKAQRREGAKKYRNRAEDKQGRAEVFAPPDSRRWEWRV